MNEFHFIFYIKIVCSKDEERVKRKFIEASKCGIIIKKTSLTCQDFVHHLSHFGPIILLTNASLLTCDMCRGNWLTTELRSCLPWSTNYAGKLWPIVNI